MIGRSIAVVCLLAALVSVMDAPGGLPLVRAGVDSIPDVGKVLSPGETPDDLADGPAIRRPTRDRFSTRADLFLLHGTRSELSGKVRVGSHVDVGVRFSGETQTAYLFVSGIGVLRSLAVGNLRLRVGERLLLGRGLIGYSLSTTGPVREGATVASSLSRWSGRPGVAVSLGAGQWVSGFVVIGERSDPSLFDARMLWISLDRKSTSLTTGATVGVPAYDRGGNRRARVGSAYLLFRKERLELSGEVANWSASGTYVALRAATRGRDGWALRCYRAPVFAAADLPLSGGEPLDSWQQGVTMRASRGLAKLRLRWAVFIVSRFSPDDRRRYRRVQASLVGKMERGEWEAGVIAIDDVIDTYTAAPLSERRSTAERQVRFRLKLRSHTGKPWSQSIRIDYRPGDRWGKDGLGVSVGLRATMGRVEAECRATAYRMASGQSMLLTRPGVGYFEWFSVAWGHGSDLSLRLRGAVTQTVSLLGYWGQPWLREQRIYVGVRVVLR